MCEMTKNRTLVTMWQKDSLIIWGNFFIICHQVSKPTTLWWGKAPPIFLLVPGFYHQFIYRTSHKMSHWTRVGVKRFQWKVFMLGLVTIMGGQAQIKLGLSWGVVSEAITYNSKQVMHFKVFNQTSKLSNK